MRRLSGSSCSSWQAPLKVVDVTEGNAGSTSANFTVTLSAASGQPVTVAYRTANGTAIAGSDYAAASGTLTFAPGVTIQSIIVAVTGDTAIEADEVFFVNLGSPVNATIVGRPGAGTIVNDEP
jgi:large repetitive protein